ncbi:MAG TPA: ribosome assembly RNA-binding protein YhbY [Arenimonas sp.]|nr:ribosome assembly RNA-binding protein YhbY [Arenimonas sp.]
MSSALSNPQKRYLRGLAHGLKPVLMVGAKGVTDPLLAEAELVLEQHELVKVKVAAGDRELRDQWIAELCERSGAALVDRIGNIAVLYRRSREMPLIALPKG